jgi:DNA-binding MarR family transcriptional regulator
VNAFDTQIVRKKHNVSWNEEYIIAMVHHNVGINTMRILEIAGMQKVMSPATAHKYLSQAIAKKFLKHKHDKEDLRGKTVLTTAKGKHFLEEIKNAYNRT